MSVQDTMALVEGGSSHLVPIQMLVSPRLFCCGLPMMGTNTTIEITDEGICSIRVYAEIETNGEHLIDLLTKNQEFADILSVCELLSAYSSHINI